MKVIKLVNNKGDIWVDDEDYEWLLSFGGWYYSPGGSSTTYYADGKIKGNKTIKMHRVIMQKYYGKSKLGVDHIDNNGFNNQKSNLRYATQSQNVANTKKIGRKIHLLFIKG